LPEKEGGKVVNISIDSVARIRVSEIEEEEPDEDDEDDEDDEPFYRRITIELESGEEIEFDLYAASGESLDLFLFEEDEEDEE
jgi:hypothetical protein